MGKQHEKSDVTTSIPFEIWTSGRQVLREEFGEAIPGILSEVRDTDHLKCLLVKWVDNWVEDMRRRLSEDKVLWITR